MPNTFLAQRRRPLLAQEEPLPLLQQVQGYHQNQSGAQQLYQQNMVEQARQQARQQAEQARQQAEYQRRLAADEVGVEPYSLFLGRQTEDPSAGFEFAPADFWPGSAVVKKGLLKAAAAVPFLFGVTRKGGGSTISGMKIKPGQPIPDEVKKEMVSTYNRYLDSPDDNLERFLSSSDSNNFRYDTYTRDDLIEIFGDDVDEEALEIAKKHGKVVQAGYDVDVDYFPPDSAPTEAEFFREAAEDSGWVIDQRASSFDEMLAGEPDFLQLSHAFETYADNLDGWVWKEVDGSFGSSYYRLSRPLTEGELRTAPQLAEEADGVLNVGIRVSNHSRQSQRGHATRGKADVDINIAPSKDGDNIYHYAESFEEAHDRLGRATVNTDGEVIFPGQLLDNFTNETRVALADIPDTRLQEATSEGYDLSTIWYHGTPSEDGLYGGIDKNPTKHSIYNTSKEPGFFITRDPDMAADYAGENGVIEKLVIKHESGRYYPEIPGGYTTDRGSGQILEFGDTDYSRSPTVVPGAADSFIPFNLVDESVLIIKGSKLKNLRD